MWVLIRGNNRVSGLDSTIDAKVNEGRTHLAQERDFECCRMPAINIDCFSRTKP